VTRLDRIRTRLGIATKAAKTNVTTTASVPTASASRYLQQLCKHWSHKLEVVFDAAHGTIRFPSGAVATLKADEAALVVTIEAPDMETREQMKGVMAKHLDRFAFREAPLLFGWN